MNEPFPRLAATPSAWERIGISLSTHADGVAAKRLFGPREVWFWGFRHRPIGILPVRRSGQRPPYRASCVSVDFESGIAGTGGRKLWWYHESTSDNRISFPFVRVLPRRNVAIDGAWLWEC